MVQTLGERIGMVRRVKEIGVQQAADACGVSRQSFWYWQNDEKKPNKPEVLLGFCRLADVSLDWLVNGGEALEIAASIPQLAMREPEAAAFLGLTVNELKAAVKSGHLPGPRLLGDLRLYDTALLRAAYLALPRR